MKTLSPVYVPTAGRTCLLVFLCLLAGCWDSHPKQEAGNQSAASGQPAAAGSGATASNIPPSQKTVESSSERTSGHIIDPEEYLPSQKTVESSAEKTAATRGKSDPADELGFKHTLKPGSTPPAKSSVTSAVAVAATAIVAHRETEDDRYGEVIPGPYVGNQAAPIKLPAVGDPPAGPVQSVEAAKTPLSDNPLRDPGAAADTGRPEAPPQLAPPSEPLGIAPRSP